MSLADEVRDDLRAPARLDARRPRPALPTRLPAHAADAAILRAEASLGPPTLVARIDRLLAQCRRQRGVMALVCVRIERVEVAADDPPLAPALERQVCDDLACRMGARVRGTDLVVREDERAACALLPGAGDDAARRVEERFARALGGAYRIGERLVQVSVRVGRAAFPDDGAQPGELVDCAKERLARRG